MSETIHPCGCIGYQGAIVMTCAEHDPNKKLREERDLAIARAGRVEELAGACAFLDERYPNINTRFTALLYARMGKEHEKDTLAERIVSTARAFGWTPSAPAEIPASVKARVLREVAAKYPQDDCSRWLRALADEAEEK